MARRFVVAIMLVLAVVAVLAVGAFGAAAAPPASPLAQATGTPQASPPAEKDGARPRVEKRLPALAGQGWLGVQVETAANGVAVRAVVPASPAAAAGIAVDDVITRVNDGDVKTAADVVAAVRAVKPGDTIRLTIRRGAETKEVQVKAGEWPAAKIQVPPVAKAPLGNLLPLVPGLKELEGIRGEDLFAHFLGGEYSLTDKDGKAFTVRLTPGETTAVSGDGLSVKVNGPAGSARDFKVDDNTRVRPGGARTTGVAVGDKVVVITVGDSDVASLILRVGMPKIVRPAGQEGSGLEIPRGDMERFFRELPNKLQPRKVPAQPAPAGGA